MRMDVATLRQKTDGELRRELIEQREALRKTSFELAAGRVKNIHAIRTIRRTIARILTILNERKRSATS